MHLCHKCLESPSPMQQQLGTEKAEICFGCITRRCWSFTPMKDLQELESAHFKLQTAIFQVWKIQYVIDQVAKRLLLFRMVSTIEHCSSISSVSCKRDDSAMMACISVHILWFMTAKKSFCAQIAVSASLLAISSCTFLLHQMILSLHQFLQNCSMRKCHCYLQHKKEIRKKNSSSSNSALSLSLR